MDASGASWDSVGVTSAADTGASAVVTAAVRRALVITADDRSGALEAAAECADRGLLATVLAGLGANAADVAIGCCTVADIDSRHLDPASAAERMRRVVASHHVVAHKIDSTLRGNWDAEIGAIAGAGRRVLVIPAHPLAGRVCRGGTVFVDGVPVSESTYAGDGRSDVTTSRPASRLAGSVELAGAHDVNRWLAAGPANRPIAVVDAATVADIEAVVDAWCTPSPGSAGRAAGVVVCGPAVVVGIAACRSQRGAGPGGVQSSRILSSSSASVRAPVLVIVGSLHPASRAQLAALRRRGVPVVGPGDAAGLRGLAGSPVAVIAGDPDGKSARPADVGVAAALGVAARTVVGHRWFATVILVGGETAAAFIGDAAVQVHGSLALGIAAGAASIGGRRIEIVTKPGGFGDPQSLVRLLVALLPHGEAGS